MANLGRDDVDVSKQFSINGDTTNFMDGDTMLEGWSVSLQDPATFVSGVNQFTNGVAEGGGVEPSMATRRTA